jgi:AcrR family transcriptional regulator
MGRPRRMTDQDLDAAARETFLEHGASAPLSLVADRLGVSRAALIQRAGSKESLLLRALRPGAPEVAAELAERPPADGKRERLEAMLRALLAFHQAMLPGLMVLRAGGFAAEAPREPPTLRLRALLARWLQRATSMEKRRAAVLADAMLGSIEARCFNAYLGGPAYIAGTHERFVHDLVGALVPELEQRRGGRR